MAAEPTVPRPQGGRSVGARPGRPALAARRSPRHELLVGAFRDLGPARELRLESREGSVHGSCHRALLRFLFDDSGRQLLEVAQYRRRQLEYLDLALELGLELLEGDGVLRLYFREPRHP